MIKPRLYCLPCALALLASAANAQTLAEAQALFDGRRFYEATDVLVELIDRKGLSDTDRARAHLLRGRASLNRLRYPLAYSDFEQAYALDADDPQAQHWFGVALKYGYNGTRDTARARGLLESASAGGVAEADYELAQMYLSVDVSSDAGRSALLRGAERREPRATMALARSYELGQTVEQDAARAFALYQQGAELGLADALYKVSNALRYGLGVEVDEAQAAAVLERALAAGSPEAEFVQGNAFEAQGDWNQANYHYWRAAESDHLPSSINLGVGYMTGDRGLRQDSSLAIHWLYQARNAPYGAMYSAVMLDMGLGVTENSTLAYELLNPIADLNVTTKSLMAMMLAAGRGTESDPERAAALFTELEQYENAEALNEAAWMLATHPVPAARRPELARSLAERALALGDSYQYMDTLATAYANSGDFELAAQWQERAIAGADAAGEARNDMLERRLAAFRAGEPWNDGPFGVFEYTAPIERTTRTRAEFIGEIVQLFPRNSQNNPRGFDTEIGHSEWGLRILVQSVEAGDLPRFMLEYGVFYIHSPTIFFAPLPEDVGLLSAPAGPHRFVLREIARNGWSYELAIEPL